jgi:hypothetical protein
MVESSKAPSRASIGRERNTMSEEKKTLYVSESDWNVFLGHAAATA